MGIRADRENYSAQEQALTVARQVLAEHLDELSRHAKTAARAARGRFAQPDLDAVYAAASRVREAHEAADLAAYDLQTARGEDG